MNYVQVRSMMSKVQPKYQAYDFTSIPATKDRIVGETRDPESLWQSPASEVPGITERTELIS
jgi:hypothetical protein